MSAMRQDDDRIIDQDGQIVDDTFTMLDPYAEGGVADAEGRPDWLATISAGFKNDKGFPQASRDGVIHLHDDANRAPTLAAALEATDGKRLTVVFPHDELPRILLQRFARRSASALEVYGDQYGVTEIVNGQHRHYPAGDPQFKALIKTCKVECRLLFYLGRWEGDHASIVLDDGLLPYSLRFTSRNSLRSIIGSINQLKLLTGGRIAGIPHELQIAYREVAGPDGKKRDVAVWSLQFRLPGGLQLTSGNFSGVIAAALAEGQRLKALAPATVHDSIAVALLEGPDADMDEGLPPPPAPDEAIPMPAPAAAQLQRMADGDPLCDPDAYRAGFFAAVRGTSYDTDDGRADLLSRYTEGQTASLASFLATATESEATRLVAWASEAAFAEIQEQRRAALRESLGGRRSRDVLTLDDDAEPRRARPAPGLATAAEPEPKATLPDGSEPAPKAWRDHYAELLSEARGLGMTDSDLAPFVIDAQTTRQRLAELGEDLRHEIGERHQAKAKAQPTPAASEPAGDVHERYRERLIEADRLGIDLAPFETSGDTTETEYAALDDRLAARIAEVKGQQGGLGL